MLIDAYRAFVGPVLGRHCRFWPSCSAYARTAMAQHGAVRGLGLAAARLARCHPWHLGGVDPVPGPRRAPMFAPTPPQAVRPSRRRSGAAWATITEGH